MKNIMERTVARLGGGKPIVEGNEILYAGRGAPVEFSTTLTIKVSGTIHTMTYVDKATEKPAEDRAFEIDYDRDEIQKQVEQQMLPVVSKAVGEELPEQSAGSWASINFVNHLGNKDYVDRFKKRWGMK